MTDQKKWPLLYYYFGCAAIHLWIVWCAEYRVKRSESNFCYKQNESTNQEKNTTTVNKKKCAHDEDITIEPDDHKVINIFTWNFYGTLFRFISLLLDFKI